MKIYVASSDKNDILSQVRDFVAEKTHLNFTAFEIVSISAIPKNASGKTLYSELQ